MSDSEYRYTSTAIALHWLIAVIAIAQFAWGIAMQEIPKQPPGLRADAYNLHKSIGLTLLALMVVRLLWRAAHDPPSLPAMPAWQRRAAHANHVLLYVVLVALPLTGYLGSVFSGYPVRYFGIVLPAWGWKSEAIKSAMSVAHFTLAWLFAFGVALHVAAVLRHTFVDRDGLIRRMWPRRSESQSRAATQRSPGVPG